MNMEIKKRKIGIDIDDVALNFYSSFSKFVQERYGVEVSPDGDFISFWNLLGSKEKTIEAVKKYDSEGHTYECNFFDDFLMIFPLLNQEFDISFITARNFDDKWRTREFFEKRLEGFSSRIHYTRDYFHKNKGKICNHLGIEIMVEDNARNARDCVSCDVDVFLIDKPWNQDVNHEKIFRVNDWYEIFGRLKE